MDTSQWTTQEINGVEKSTSEMGVEKKVSPPNEQTLNCPRCNSTNTKFCYYNNYSLNQPRYLCKTCRRYWTEGGTLRNVPVGGGSRKNRKSSSSFSISTSASSSSHNQLLDLNPPFISHQFSDQNPNGHDLNLAFHEAPQHEYYDGAPQFLQIPKSENSDNVNSSCSNTAIGFSFDGRLSIPVGETRRYLGTNEVVNDQINEGQESYNGSWNRIFGGGSW